jgi:hypothetical protein
MMMTKSAKNPRLEPPKPLTTQLEEQIMEIRSRLHDLLLKSNLVYRDHSSDVVVFVEASSYWTPLADDGRALQWELRKDTRRWFDLVAQILTDREKGHLKQLKQIREFCEHVIDQNHAMWERDTDTVARRLWKDLTKLMDTVKGLYSESQRPTFVPDTNALIYNPALEEWDFAREDGAIFEVVLVPIVLSELDDLKGGRPELPRTEKAQRVIRQIKEYQRRGSLLNGVVLRKDRSVVSSLAVEPDFKRTLSWLDPTVADDRFLTSTLEIVKRRPHAAVLAVTGDVNLQNKFAMAGLPHVEPPEPAATNVVQPRSARSTMKHPRPRSMLNSRDERQ